MSPVSVSPGTTVSDTAHEVHQLLAAVRNARARMEFLVLPVLDMECLLRRMSPPGLRHDLCHRGRAGTDLVPGAELVADGASRGSLP